MHRLYYYCRICINTRLFVCLQGRLETTGSHQLRCLRRDMTVLGKRCWRPPLHAPALHDPHLHCTLRTCTVSCNEEIDDLHQPIHVCRQSTLTEDETDVHGRWSTGTDATIDATTSWIDCHGHHNRRTSQSTETATTIDGCRRNIESSYSSLQFWYRKDNYGQSFNLA